MQFICQCTSLYVPCWRRLYPSVGGLHSDVPVSGLKTDCEGLTILYSQVLQTKNGQPFIIAGSGTLGWDQVPILEARITNSQSL